MSHWRSTCITMTDDPTELEKMLAPYDETLEIEQFVEEYDGVTETYWRNPLAKWDWWLVGGRWSNWLKRNDGVMVDMAMKGDVDVNAMRVDAGVKAAQRWDRIDAICRPLPVATSWSECRNESGADIDAARSTFHAQPRVKALAAIEEFRWDAGSTIDEYQSKGREVQSLIAARKAVPGLSLVTAEGWIEDGKMGWFGTSTSTDESAEDFGIKANRIIDALPDSAWLWIVDFHV